MTIQGRALLAAALAALAARAAAAPPAEVLIGFFDSETGNAQFANYVEWLNSRDDVLPNTTVTARYYNHMNTPSRGFFGALELGDYCSNASVEAVQLSVGWPWSSMATNGGLVAKPLGMPMIGSTSSSPALSNLDLYPTYSRVMPSDDLQGLAIARMCASYGWRKVGVIHSTDAYGTGLANRFVSTVTEDGGSIVSAQQLEEDQTQEEVDARVAALKASGVRVVLVASFGDAARMVLRAAMAEDMVGPQYVWILTEASGQPSADELANSTYGDQWPAWDGLLSFSPLVPTDTPEFLALAARITEAGTDVFPYPPSQWDALRMESLELGARGFDALFAATDRCDALDAGARAADAECAALDALGSDSERLTYMLRRTSYNGTSGPVRLDESGDRLGSYGIYLHRHHAGSADEPVTFEQVGGYDGPSGELRWTGDVTFYGGSARVPVDAPEVVAEERTISPGLFYGVTTLAGLVALAAVGVVAFTVSQRKRKIIQMSSPNINNLSSAGSVLGMLTLVVMGLGQDTTAKCTAQLWMAALSFTVIFGPLFAKIYRVASIFNAKKLKIRKVDDWLLLRGVLYMLAVDVLVLSLWTAINPLEPAVESLPQEASGSDLVVEPYVHQCQSENQSVWMGVVMGYKALILLKGAQLAYAVRGVDVPALNDAKWIGFAVYNLLVCFLFAVPVALMLKDSPSAAYGIVSFASILAVAMTLALVNLPKIVAIATGTEEEWTTRSLNTTAQGTRATAISKHAPSHGGAASPSVSRQHKHAPGSPGARHELRVHTAKPSSNAGSPTTSPRASVCMMSPLSLSGAASPAPPSARERELERELAGLRLQLDAARATGAGAPPAAPAAAPADAGDVAVQV